MGSEIKHIGVIGDRDYFKDRFQNIYTIIDGEVFFTGNAPRNTSFAKLFFDGKLEPYYKVESPTLESLMKSKEVK